MLFIEKTKRYDYLKLTSYKGRVVSNYQKKKKSFQYFWIFFKLTQKINVDEYFKTSSKLSICTVREILMLIPVDFEYQLHHEK